jgi:hypothetical protein
MLIVTAIEPGPLSSGIATGMNAISRVSSASSRCASGSSSSGSGSSIRKPTRATTMPPAIRSAGSDIPKKVMISAPAKSDTSSTEAM